jgi:hypothetical protein
MAQPPGALWSYCVVRVTRWDREPHPRTPVILRLVNPPRNVRLLSIPGLTTWPPGSDLRESHHHYHLMSTATARSSLCPGGLMLAASQNHLGGLKHIKPPSPETHSHHPPHLWSGIQAAAISIYSIYY